MDGNIGFFIGLGLKAAIISFIVGRNEVRRAANERKQTEAESAASTGDGGIDDAPCIDAAWREIAPDLCKAIDGGDIHRGRRGK